MNATDDRKEIEILPARSNWNRLYLFVLAFNAILIVIFYALRLMFNSPA